MSKFDGLKKKLRSGVVDHHRAVAIQDQAADAIEELEQALGATLGVCVGETMSKHGLINALEKAKKALGETK